jgi:hypothetical protein
MWPSGGDSEEGSFRILWFVLPLKMEAKRVDDQIQGASKTVKTLYLLSRVIVGHHSPEGCPGS